MPVNSNINVILTKSENGFSALNQTSPLHSINNINQNMGFKNYFNNFDKAVQGGGVSSSAGFGALKTAGAIAAVIATVDKGLTIGYTIAYSYSGEKIQFNNRMKAKKYALNPLSFIIDSTYGVALRQMQIDRENTSNERGRELSGNLIIGSQFGNK